MSTSGSEKSVLVNTAIADAVRIKHKKEVHVTSWFLPDTPDIHGISPHTTAEELSSQEAEAEVQPVMVPQDQIDSLKTQTDLLKTQTDLMMRQMSSDFQHRIRNVASLVMGRLVRSASLNTQAKSALTNYCKTPKRRHLRQLLHKTGMPETPEAFASHFDGLYSSRCGEPCCIRCLFCFDKLPI